MTTLLDYLICGLLHLPLPKKIEKRLIHILVCKIRKWGEQMKEYISKDEIIEHFSKRVNCPAGEDNSKERYRYIQWATDYNSIISIPAVKAIPLEMVIQAREEIQKLVNMLSNDTVADVNMKSGLGMALEKIDKLIEENEGE